VYPSGRWEGFWVQGWYGRQTMKAFNLEFSPRGEITGSGRDVIGPFSFAGAYDLQTGEVIMMKEYTDKHHVLYKGRPDGDECIQGTWSIGDDYSGPFLMKPVLGRPSGDEPIDEIE